MQNILRKIVRAKKKELIRNKRKRPLSILKQTEYTPIPFINNSKNSFLLICEVKKASPSKGVFLEDFNPVAIAREYEDCGAGAISVLTEKDFFQGDLDYLRHIRKNVKLPLLRKDFIFSAYQIYESLYFHADCILLIASMLSSRKLHRLISLAHKLKLSVLLEVHNRKELKKALKTKADLIGVNNRDLKTFKTDLQTTIDLCKSVPQNRFLISESGIFSNQDIKKLKQAQIKGALVGESLIKSKNRKKLINELLD